MSRLRPTETDRTLAVINAQTLPLASVLVVNVEADPESERVVHSWSARCRRVDYLPLPENVGPAGAVAAGVAALLQRWPDAAYVALFEDDDPPPGPDAVSRLVQHLERQPQDTRVGGAGLHGARLQWRRARLRRPRAAANGSVDVDYIAGGSCPVLRTEMLRQVGAYDPDLFFGFEELEFGLRARRAGWRLHVLDDENDEHPIALDARLRHSWGLGDWSWRRYYSLRNLIVILRRHHHPLAATQVAVVRGLVKPLVWMPRHPRLAMRHLRGNITAIRDAFTERLGRTIPPE